MVIPRQRRARPRGGDSGNGILDDQADARFQTEPTTRRHENIGGTPVVTIGRLLGWVYKPRQAAGPQSER